MIHSVIRFVSNFFLFTLYIILFYSCNTVFASTETKGFNNQLLNTGTVIPGGNISGTFNQGGSPYYINGDITIQDQQTLTIDAGVEVIFNGSYKLTVNGRLLANGTSDDTIQFKPLNASIKWRGIRFEDILMTNDSSKLVFCKITGSLASDGSPSTTSLDNGGGLYIRNTNKIVVMHTIISGNISENQGGGVYINNSKIVFRNNCIIGNTAFNEGGGIYVVQNSVGYIQNNKISNNNAVIAGGVMLNACNNLIFNNNLISFNNASSKAGGIYFANGCNGKYSNNTISRNKCNGYGDGLYISSSNPKIYNSIIWYNEEGTGANVYINNDGAVPDFYYSNIQNGSASFAGPNGWTYTGIYQNNVDFTPGFWAWGDDYFNISFISPCVNRGTIDTTGLNLPATDIIGNPRNFGNHRIDIGAYEFQGNQNLNEISGNLSGVLSTANTPYYVTGDIVIPEGQTLILERGIQLYFLGYFSITVRGTIIANGETESILFASLDTTDFCKTNLNNGAWNRMIFENTSTGCILNHCDFQFSKSVKPTDNYPFMGGNIVIDGSSPTFKNCSFYFGVALKGGGLAVLNTPKTVIENCSFEACRTIDGGKGSALYIENASPNVFGSLFVSNTACDDNNQLKVVNYIPSKVNNLGGAVYIINSESRFINNTIANNHASQGGAFYINEEAGITLKNKLRFFNNIIWGNDASSSNDGNQFYINSPTDSFIFKHNDIMGGLNAITIQGNVPYNGIYENNIDDNPLFTGS